MKHSKVGVEIMKIMALQVHRLLLVIWLHYSVMVLTHYHPLIQGSATFSPTRAIICFSFLWRGRIQN